MDAITSDPKLAGLRRDVAARKETSLRKLREAALALFSTKGFVFVSIDDIARAAGVTRKTFYRHFAGKAEIARDLFEMRKAQTAIVLGGIDGKGAKDRAIVVRWIDGLIDHNINNPAVRAFVEVSLSDPVMRDRLADYGPLMVGMLGQRIPAFAFEPATPYDDRRFVQACLLITDIINLCALYAAGVTHIPRAMLVDVLAERFRDFAIGVPDPI